ncbi:hypothetical protein [Inquilinus limosus]|uniref:Uncharacterized protein n=1 Tax=Inquilinus limosus TaxID=171674 RepID=A0A211Z6B3_9PROT|nr:hypothetical protein [Inquilinus limosus]OWJ60819.1 hypothetical protein BWR60_31645 [Inquilinus limosus]
MAIKDILMERATWTWSIMAASAQLGEMIREDAITSVNLATIANLAAQQGVELSITSFQGAKLEKEFGADWMWTLGQSAYLVQAKRLDVVPGRGGLSYLIDIAQLETLCDAAHALSVGQGIDSKPAYVFYNSLLQGSYNPAQSGCTWVNAYVLREALNKAGKLGQASTVLAFQAVVGDLKARPWTEMFGG